MAKEKLNKEGFEEVSGGGARGSKYKELQARIKSEWDGKIKEMSSKELLEMGCQAIVDQNIHFDKNGFEYDDKCYELGRLADYFLLASRDRN